MVDTPNYAQSTLAGDSWIRVNKVLIHNPYNGTPWLQLMEERIFVLNNETSLETVSRSQASITVNFDVNNPKHLALYNTLNEIYVEERTKRDTPVEPPVTP